MFLWVTVPAALVAQGGNSFELSPYMVVGVIFPTTLLNRGGEKDYHTYEQRVLFVYALTVTV